MKYILLLLTFITSTAFAQFDTKSNETKVINAYANAGTTLTDNVITLFCMGPR